MRCDLCHLMSFFPRSGSDNNDGMWLDFLLLPATQYDKRAKEVFLPTATTKKLYQDCKYNNNYIEVMEAVVYVGYIQ